MKFFRTSYLVLLILSLVTVGLIVADTACGGGSDIFSNIGVVFLLIVYVVLQLICLFRMKPSFTLHRVGYYLLHVGLVLFLVGHFAYYIGGDRTEVTLPVGSDTYGKIQRVDENGLPTDEFTDLGFQIGVASFRVEQYPADENGRAADKFYEAALVTVDRTSLLEQVRPLTVNGPVHENGWKIYLMNYGGTEETGYRVLLLLKRDPGEVFSDMGIWFTIAGAFLLCIRRKTGKEGRSRAV